MVTYTMFFFMFSRRQASAVQYTRPEPSAYSSRYIRSIGPFGLHSFTTPLRRDGQSSH